MKPSPHDQLFKIILMYKRENLPLELRGNVAEVDVKLALEDAQTLARIAADRDKFKKMIRNLMSASSSRDLSVRESVTLDPEAVERFVRITIMFRILDEWLHELMTPLYSEPLRFSQFIELHDLSDQLGLTFEDLLEPDAKKVFLIRVINHILSGNFIIDHPGLDRDDNAHVGRSKYVDERVEDLRKFGFALLRANSM